MNRLHVVTILAVNIKGNLCGLYHSLLAAECNESTPASEAWVAFLYQTLVLATIGYREEQQTETPFLIKENCFSSVLRSNRQVDDIHKEPYGLLWPMAFTREIDRDKARGVDHVRP